MTIADDLGRKATKQTNKSIGMGCVISGLCFERTILQRNSMVKKIGSHNMTMLYPNLCLNEVFYKGNVLY